MQTNNTKPEEGKEILHWHNRYSDTLEDDKQGRWGRIAYAGNPPFTNGRKSMFEIAWIKKLEIEGNLRFTVHPVSIPYSGKFYHDTFEEAQQAVESEFNWFIQCVSPSSTAPQGEEITEEAAFLALCDSVLLVDKKPYTSVKKAKDIMHFLKKQGFTISKTV